VKIWLGLLAGVVALVLPGSALAAQCAPPGNSGVSQYAETIPGAGCNQAPGNHHHGGGGGGHMPSGTSRTLASQGGAGHAVSQLVANTGTAGTAGTTGALASGAGSGQAGGSSGSSSSSNSGASKSGGSTGAGAASQTQTNVTPPSVNGRGLLSALLHPIVTGASSAGGAGIWLPIFLGVVLVLAVVALIRRNRLTAARRRWTS
jgi:hypothetical protein